jgi:hypothetical protein
MVDRKQKKRVLEVVGARWRSVTFFPPPPNNVIIL